MARTLDLRAGSTHRLSRAMVLVFALLLAAAPSVSGGRAGLRPDVALLIALAHATGLMRIHFDKRELKDRKGRIERIAKGDLIGSATADAVRAAEAAVQAAQAAVMTALIASTVVTNVTH